MKSLHSVTLNLMVEGELSDVLQDVHEIVDAVGDNFPKVKVTGMNMYNEGRHTEVGVAGIDSQDEDEEVVDDQLNEEKENGEA